MAIDFHAHLAHGGDGAPPFMRRMFDPAGYLEAQAAAGLELTVLSYAPPELQGTDGELDEARRQHDFLAGLVADHPGRFAALAGVDPFGGTPWLDEAQRALDAGFAGLCFPTSRHDAYLDMPEAQEAFAFAEERGAVIFVHPSQSAVSAERVGHGMLQGWIGQPVDTGICLSRLLLADTLSRYPRVRLVAAHCGGTLPMLLGRLDRVFHQLRRTASKGPGAGPPAGGPPGGGPPGGGPPGGGPPGGGPPESAGRTHGPGASSAGGGTLTPALDGPPPSERLGPIYLDTAGYHEAAVTAAIAMVGTDRVVVGTDHPPAGDSPAQALDVVLGLDLAPAARDAILSGNARALLAGASIT